MKKGSSRKYLRPRMESREGFTMKEVIVCNRSPNIIRVIKSRKLRWTCYVARMEEGRGAFKILTDKPTGRGPLGRPRRRWEDNIRMDLEAIGINAGN